MAAASVSWSSIAGNLHMPVEFADMFLDGSGIDHSQPPRVNWSTIAGGLRMPTEFANLFVGDPRIAANVVIQSPPRRRRCSICGSIHSELTPCACFRCGRQHQGDCATVCTDCGRCHPSTSRCRRAVPIYFTNRRRSLATFSNDDFDGVHVSAVRHDIGEMNVECAHCRSKKWSIEKINCCHAGDVVVPWDVQVPPALSSIILCPHVRQNIRAYNTVLAFASTGHQNKSIVGGTFVLGGRTYHRIGSILPGTIFMQCSDFAA